MTRAPNFRRRRLAAAFAHASPAPAALAAFFVLAGIAQAQQFDYSAVIAGQGRINGPVNAGGIVWQCNPKYCTTRGPWPVPGVKSCNALAKIVGPLTSYGYQGRMLSPNDMAVCNGNQTATTYQAPANTQTQPGQQPPNQSAVAANPLAALLQTMANANNGNGANTNTSNNANNSGGASGSSGSSGSSTPPPGATPPASTPAPSAAVSGPTSIRTAQLTVTGTGMLRAGPAFAPLSIRTMQLQVTGTGALFTGPAFTPMTIHSIPLTVTGTGSL